MPVRTSAVVAGGLALMAVVGVITVFGESLRAVIAPPAATAEPVAKPVHVATADAGGGRAPGSNP